MPQNTFPMQGVFVLQWKRPPRTPVNCNSRSNSTCLFWLENKWDVYMSNFDKLWSNEMLWRGQVKVWTEMVGWDANELNYSRISKLSSILRSDSLGGIRRGKEFLAYTLAFLWRASLAEIVAQWLKSDWMLWCRGCTHSLYHKIICL